MSDGPVLEVKDLKKTMGSVDAVRGLSFSVGKGSIYGLIGPNGSGKTTAIKCLLGLLRPEAGECRVLGEDSKSLSRACRQRVGYLSEKPFPWQDLVVPDLLRFLAALFDRWDGPRMEALGKRMGVALDRPLNAMSFGERRKAELFLALAPDPEVLVLDDPWLGVDARVRRDFLLALLEETRERGRTVLFTSHILTDVEKVADRVAILVNGTIRTEDDMDALKARVKRIVIELRPGVSPDEVVVAGEVSRALAGGVLTLVTSAFAPDVEARLAERFGRVTVEPLNLEAAFVELTGTPEEAAA
jgi:ABC-2 type transport system ATP-binding protein